MQANSGKLKEANSTAREGGQGEPCLADRANPPCPTIRGEPCQPKCGKGFYCKINDPVDIQSNGCCFSGKCQYLEMERTSTSRARGGGLGEPCLADRANPPCPTIIGEPCQPKCGKGFYCKINDPVDIQINGCCFSGTCQYFEMEHASTYQSNNNGANLKQPDSTKEDFGAILGRPAKKTSTTPKATSSTAEPIKQRRFSVLLAELLILTWVKP